MEAWTVVGFVSLPRVMVFEGSAIGWSIPGDFPIRAHVFTGEGEWLTSENFSGGWRAFCGSPTVTHSTMIGAEIIKIGCAPDGVATWTQYYGLRNNRLVLLRLEDEFGKAIPNEYGAPNWTMGPIPKAPQEINWEEMLSSGSLPERLAALVWIGGTHVDPNLPADWESFHEDIRIGAFCEELRRRPGVAARLQELAASSNLWEREAALLALSPQRYH
jgi:hypothetical protein